MHSTRSTTIRTRQQAQTSSSAGQIDEKENIKMSIAQGKARATRRNAKTYCICKKPDDGSPMIHCSSCKDWYHFRCVELSEQDAEEIQLYVCPSCQQRNGARIIKDWEDGGVKEQVHSTAVTSTTSSQEAVKATPDLKMLDEHDSEPSSDGSDEYNPETDRAPKRRVRRQYQSEDDSDLESARGQSPKRLRRGSAAPKAASPTHPTPTHTSPTPTPTTSSHQSKRKKSTSAPVPPPAKRPRSESTSGEDPARKYCLTKLQELFCDIFMRYPFLRQPGEDNEMSEMPAQPEKKPEELTDEEKEQLDTRAKRFGVDVEQCMYELYSEPDKQGKQVVAAKYKERFRMLTFNLGKADRIVLHMRLASSRISPKELSTMSSTDLASEEEKQSIKKLEEEALAHSILKKSVVPRAKLTHKGLQDIEDVTGAGQREAEREREEEEEERIERERLARLRLQAQRAQSQQGSAPPESPVVGQAPSSSAAAWGAPPPVPAHAHAHAHAHAAADHHAPSPTTAGAVRPLFVPSASDYAGPSENELNLADFINIDEEPSGEIAMTPVESLPTPFGEIPAPLLSSEAAHKSAEGASQPPPGSPSPSPSSSSSPTTNTNTHTNTNTRAAGISPFAAKGSQPDSGSRLSFDLNALWTPGPSDAAHPESEEAQEPPPAGGGEGSGEAELVGGEAEDQDFDMFLGNNDQEQGREPLEGKEPTPVELTPEARRAAFDAQSPVWAGTLSMPLDSAIPQEVAVVARQSGGRTLNNDSPLWQTLFPSNELRIDGRVPVEKSAQYLTQIRMKPSKELIAAAFSPAPGGDPAGFDALKNHLLSKGRHGLIFPWGHNPKSSAPGRELYVVPLTSAEPIPEYMELFDELQLPRERTADYLIGVWVLTKGKLVPPPPQPTPTPAPAPPTATAASSALSTSGTSVGVPPALPNIDFAQLQQLSAQLPPHALLTSASPAVPAPAAAPHPPPISAPLSAPLSAEVALLTPEQIQLMLQTLTKTAQSVPGAGAGAGGSIPIPPPPPAWTSQHPGAQQYPPPYASYPGPGPGPSHSPPGAYGGEYDQGHERERERERGGFHGHNNNNNNNNNNGGYGGYGGDRGFRGRGRGRGGGGGRVRDQGWSRGAARGGRGGHPPSGPRNRGGGWS